MPPRKRAAVAFAAVSKKAAKTEEEQTITQAIEQPEGLKSPEREELSQKRVQFYSNPNEQTTSSDSDTEEVDSDLKDSEEGPEPYPLVSYLPEVGCLELHVPQICNAVGDLLKHLEADFNPIVASAYQNAIEDVTRECQSFKWWFKKDPNSENTRTRNEILEEIRKQKNTENPEVAKDLKEFK